jgi:hypothetical protein
MRSKIDPHPEERSAGAHLEGRTAGFAARLASLGNKSNSPQISDSFFSRRQPLTCRSAAIASVI